MEANNYTFDIKFENSDGERLNTSLRKCSSIDVCCFENDNYDGIGLSISKKLFEKFIVVNDEDENILEFSVKIRKCKKFWVNF